jgi:hypothetical protein
LIEVFENHGVSFLSVTERFDTSTPAGRLLRNIMLTFAQFERELTSERIRDKVIQRAHRGLYTGGHPPFGYKAEDGKLVVDPKKADAVRMMFRSYRMNHNAVYIARLLKSNGILTPSGKPYCNSFVYRVLRKLVYTGKVVHRGKVFPGQHEAIISEDVFQEVQKMLAEEIPRKGFKTRIEGHPNLPYLGLIRCQECGSIMTTAYTIKKNKDGVRRYYYYKCSKLNHKGWNACTTRQIGAERFHDIIHANLLRISRDPDYLSSKVRVHRGESVTPHPVGGIEPCPDPDDLTPEKLGSSLLNFVKACARETGTEKALAVRRNIHQVHYGKDSIGVDFILGRPLGTPESDVAPPPDGKSLVNQNLTSVPHSGTKSFCPPARTSESSLCPSAENRKSPTAFGDWTYAPGSSRGKMERFSSSIRTVRLTFPNIAHSFWDNYRLSKEFYIRRAKPVSD